MISNLPWILFGFGLGVLVFIAGAVSVLLFVWIGSKGERLNAADRDAERHQRLIDDVNGVFREAGND